jgi:hypothetical protein
MDPAAHHCGGIPPPCIVDESPLCPTICSPCCQPPLLENMLGCCCGGGVGIGICLSCNDKCY